MKKYILLGLAAFLFISLKFTNLGVRLSDTNTYYNVVNLILQGKMLYRDLLYFDFPFSAYIFSLYNLLAFKNIYLFYSTAAIEATIVAFLIYHITYVKTKNYIASTISFLLYLFSFIVLSTSDHQNGIFTASLFAVLSYYFLDKKRTFIAGVFSALAILTKAYFVPILFSFLLYLILKKNWKKLAYFVLGGICATFIILLPSLIVAPNQLISNIFGFSLTRPVGVSKSEVILFFIAKDPLFFFILLFNLINIKNNKIFGLISVFSIIFLLGYQDIYYLYLNFLIPFLCLSFYQIHNFIENNFHPQKLVIPTIVIIFLVFNFSAYLNGYRNLQKIDDIDKIVSTIKKEKPNYLYGINDLTPALLVLTKIPPLSGVNEAHPYFFQKGIYDKEQITKQALISRTIVVTHGAYYPTFNIRQDILDDAILNKDAIYKNCKNILSVPVQAEGSTNRINLFKCY